MSGRVAILIVNGYRPVTPETTADAIRYPWIELCLRQVTRRSIGSDYEVLVWDNTGLPEHRRAMDTSERVRVYPETPGTGSALLHTQAIDQLVLSTSEVVEYVVVLDTDAMPITDGWLEAMTAKLDAGGAIIGVWRNEMTPELTPFVHVSCLCMRRDDMLAAGMPFADHGEYEPGQKLTQWLLVQGRQVVGMHRTNVRNAHFLLGGIYGDTVYHHGAGSRPAWLHTSQDHERDVRVRDLLRQAAFADFDHLIAVLRGHSDNDIWPESDDAKADRRDNGSGGPG